MNFRNALLSATMLALPVAASAQPITGLYIGAGAGVNVMQDENAQFARSPFAGNVETRHAFWPSGRNEPWIRLWQWAQGGDRG